jgi:threonine dehydratase
VKHENHSPVGAFKVRGGLVYMDSLRRREPNVTGVIAATRGNHGQSVAFAASRMGLRSVIVVPCGNSREKNASMRALGAELIEYGEDFQEAYEHSAKLAEAEKLHLVRSFDSTLIAGVASYALELFDAVGELDAVYVPIGIGSGICGVVATRNALGLRTEVIGVVAARASAYAQSFAAGRPIAAWLAVCRTRRQSRSFSAVSTASSSSKKMRFGVPCGICSPTPTMSPKVRARQRLLRCSRNGSECGAGEWQ